jgi:hypothetical protein
MVLRLPLLTQRAGAPANPAQPLAAAPGAIRLRSVNKSVARALHFSGTVTIGAFPGAFALAACGCHCRFSSHLWLTLLLLSSQTAEAPIVPVS